jgi:hypothetical protein
MSKSMAVISSAVLILSILAAAWFLPPIQAWPAVIILLVGFFLVLGVSITTRPLGILVTEQNVMSLSRFQTALWTVIVVSALLVIAMARLEHPLQPGKNGELPDPLNITLGTHLLALLGISATALVGSPLIAATKKSKTPDDKVAQTTAQELVRTGNVPASVIVAAPPPPAIPTAPPPAAAGASSAQDQAVTTSITQNAEGILYKNPTINDASFSDMFEGDEVGNTAHVDLGKVQMFYFTLVVAIAYVVALWKVISDGNLLYGANFSFPAFSEGMVGLLGISNASYLAYKGVDHTKKQGP